MYRRRWEAPFATVMSKRNARPESVSLASTTYNEHPLPRATTARCGLLSISITSRQGVELELEDVLGKLLRLALGKILHR